MRVFLTIKFKWNLVGTRLWVKSRYSQDWRSWCNNIYPCPPTSHTACGQQELHYISPKRIGKENPSVIFHSSSFQWAVGLSLFSTSHTECGQRALQYISPKRIEEENPVSSSILPPFQWVVGLSLLSTSHTACVQQAPQYISLKRIEEENLSVIFHSSPFSMSGWFIFALVGSRHYTVYSCERESNRETQMWSSFLPFQVAVGLSLSSNFSHLQAGTGYFT